MHLIVGPSTDPLCEEIQLALQARGQSACIITDLFQSGSTLRWEFDSESSASALTLPDGRQLKEAQIDSVFIGSRSEFDFSAWPETDRLYAYSEANAATLGWLWSLTCPVINRLPAHLCLRAPMPMTAWLPYLSRAGLSTGAMTISNIPSQMHAFALPDGGAAYTPLTSDQNYLVAGESEWKAVEQLAAIAPVCLSALHGQPVHVCVVGEQFFWSDAAPAPARALEQNIFQLKDQLALTSISLALAPVDERWRVIAVEPQPHLRGFVPQVRQNMIEAVVYQLLQPADSSPAMWGAL